MAAGECVSVSSQADTERADLEREREGLANDRAYEHDELAAIYVQRGLDTSLAKQVAVQLMQHDALGAHARDELGISDALSARPIQAALASAGTFAVGAAMPLLVALLVPAPAIIWAVSVFAGGRKPRPGKAESAASFGSGPKRPIAASSSGMSEVPCDHRCRRSAVPAQRSFSINKAS